MWHVYVIKSHRHPFLYIGSTNDVARRLKEHNEGLSAATKPYKPFDMLVTISFDNEKQARSLEQYFKTGSGRTILKKRILNDEDLAEYDVLAEDEA